MDSLALLAEAEAIIAQGDTDADPLLVAYAAVEVLPRVVAALRPFTAPVGATINKEPTMKPMTYRDLKSKLDTLTPEQLDATIRWWGEERGGRIFGLRILECRYISDDAREGMYPITALSGRDVPAEENIEESLPEGTPILESDMGGK